MVAFFYFFSICLSLTKASSNKNKLAESEFHQALRFQIGRKFYICRGKTTILVWKDKLALTLFTSSMSYIINFTLTLSYIAVTSLLMTQQASLEVVNWTEIEWDCNRFYLKDLHYHCYQALYPCVCKTFISKTRVQ